MAAGRFIVIGVLVGTTLASFDCDGTAFTGYTNQISTPKFAAIAGLKIVIPVAVYAQVGARFTCRLLCLGIRRVLVALVLARTPRRLAHPQLNVCVTRVCARRQLFHASIPVISQPVKDKTQLSRIFSTAFAITLTFCTLPAAGAYPRTCISPSI